MRVEVGVLRGQFPYVRVGAGRQPLVVLPGMALDNGTASGLVARSYGHGFRRIEGLLLGVEPQQQSLDQG